MSVCVFSLQGSVFESTAALRLCELDLGLPSQTLRAARRSCSPCLPQSEQAEDCDERVRRRGQVELTEGVLMGEEITPESADSPAQTHTQRFAVLVGC